MSLINDNKNWRQLSGWKLEIFCDRIQAGFYKCCQCSRIPKELRLDNNNNIFCHICIENCISNNIVNPINKCKIKKSIKNDILQEKIDNLVIMCPNEYERSNIIINPYSNNILNNNNYNSNNINDYIEYTELKNITCYWKGKIKDLDCHIRYECKLQIDYQFETMILKKHYIDKCRNYDKIIQELLNEIHDLKETQNQMVFQIIYLFYIKQHYNVHL